MLLPLKRLNCDNLLSYLVFAWFLGVCYGFVLISSATRQNGDINGLFNNGDLVFYQLHSTVLLNENKDNQKNVGYYIIGDVLVQTLASQQNKKLIKIELRAPQLHIKSRKAPSPDGFVKHSSNLDVYEIYPVYIVWSNGEVEKILLSNNEPVSTANLKKGIASLFQVNVLNDGGNETDASGVCKTAYKVIDSTKIQKTKSNCLSKDMPYSNNNDKFLKSIVNSVRSTTFEINIDDKHFQTVLLNERHQVLVAPFGGLGGFVEAQQIFSFVKIEHRPVKEQTIDDILEELKRNNYIEDSLLTKKETLDEEETLTLSKAIESVRDNLKDDKLGTLTPTKSFIKLLQIARSSRKEEIAKILSSKKNKKILPQIYDILGYAQTIEVHQGVMKKLFFENEEHLDLAERYLWALSLSANPNLEIVNDLLKRYRKSNEYPEKLRETLLLTIASIAHKLEDKSEKLLTNTLELITREYELSKDEERHKYLRALKNLQSERAIPILLDTIKNGTNKEAVLAFKALKALDPKYWNENILMAARKAFLQLNRKHDSSARTLAADILLESNPSDPVLRDIINYLKSNETNFEIKQYVYQQIRRIGEENEEFNKRVNDIIKADPLLNNYSILAPKGFSTALRRNFVRSKSCNASLITVQEIFNGIAKRGVLNIMLEKDGDNREMFSLGTFCGGLSSFIGSNDEDDEATIAGMELTLFGTQIRPFVFFSSKGELMGHVWTGTGSTRTTAFQILSLLQDHLEFIRLGNGFITELNVKGALSFDISGKIEISLWNREAESSVEKTVGIYVMGLLRIDSSFVRSQVEFTASIEPKLELQTNVDFSSNMNFCMRVDQPESIFKHNVFKIERIPGSKHKLRIAKYQKTLIPGLTYALNQKNNDMCNAMFNQ